MKNKAKKLNTDPNRTLGKGPLTIVIENNGRPGTGRTTAACLIAETLKHNGYAVRLIDNGNFISQWTKEADNKAVCPVTICVNTPKPQNVTMHFSHMPGEPSSELCQAAKENDSHCSYISETDCVDCLRIIAIERNKKLKSVQEQLEQTQIRADAMQKELSAVSKARDALARELANMRLALHETADALSNLTKGASA